MLWNPFKVTLAVAHRGVLLKLLQATWPPTLAARWAWRTRSQQWCLLLWEPLYQVSRWSNYNISFQYSAIQHKSLDQLLYMALFFLQTEFLKTLNASYWILYYPPLYITSSIHNKIKYLLQGIFAVTGTHWTSLQAILIKLQFSIKAVSGVNDCLPSEGMRQI